MIFARRRFIGSAAALMVPAAGGGGGTTTFDPSHGSMTLSNGNLTAATPVGGGYLLVRTVASHTTGKYYAEFHLDSLGGSSSSFSGVLNASQSTASGNFIGGSGSNSLGYFDAGQYVFNGSNVSTIQTYAQGNTVCMAVDVGGGLIWWRTNGGNWNNSGTANPATGAGGISIGVSGALFAGVGGGFTSGTNTQWTANFGGSAYAQSAPAGFGNW